MAPINIGYWNIRGWGAPVRMILAYTGQEHEETLYECGDGPEFDCSAWGNVKYTLGMPFPNLPYLVDGDFKLSQSIAILRYLSRGHGLAGSTEQEMAYVDMVVDALNDLRNPLYDTAYEPNYKELRVEKKASFLKQIQMFEDSLTGDYVLGKSISFADFLMYETMDFAKAFLPGCLDDKVNLTALMDQIRALPQLEGYFASPPAKWAFCNKMAYFGSSWRTEA